MLQASPPPIDHFPAFLARLPSDMDLDALARQAGSFPRRRGVRSAIDLLRLALAWGPGGYSMQRVAAWAGERNIATLSEDALIQRPHGAVPYLQAVVSQLLMPVKPLPYWHGRVPRIADGTSLSQPASKGTDWRIHGVFDLASGRFTHLELTGRHGGEALDRGQPPAFAGAGHGGRSVSAIAVTPMPRPGSASVKTARVRPTISCGYAGARSVWSTGTVIRST
jgi:hypothetical protein